MSYINFTFLYNFKLFRLSDWYCKHDPSSYMNFHRLVWLEDGRGMLYLHPGLNMPVPQYTGKGWILVVEDGFVETFYKHYPKYSRCGLLVKSGSFVHVPVCRELAKEISEITRWIYRNLKNKRLVEWLQASVNLVLILFVQAYLEEHPATGSSWQSEQMSRIWELMREHYKSGHRTAFYAGHLSLTSKMVNKVCRAVAGGNLSSQLDMLKLAEAKRQLLLTNTAIKETAFDLGFSSLQSFSMFFKKMAGYSPAHYRRIGTGTPLPESLPT